MVLWSKTPTFSLIHHVNFPDNTSCDAGGFLVTQSEPYRVNQYFPWPLFPPHSTPSSTNSQVSQPTHASVVTWISPLCQRSFSRPETTFFQVLCAWCEMPQLIGVWWQRETYSSLLSFVLDSIISSLLLFCILQSGHQLAAISIQLFLVKFVAPLQLGQRESGGEGITDWIHPLHISL